MAILLKMNEDDDKMMSLSSHLGFNLVIYNFFRDTNVEYDEAPKGDGNALPPGASLGSVKLPQGAKGSASAGSNHHQSSNY